MLTVVLLLTIAAFILAIASAAVPGKVPLWVSVVLICVVLLIQALPLGR